MTFEFIFALDIFIDLCSNVVRYILCSRYHSALCWV